MSDGTPGVNGTPEKLPGTRDFELPFLEIVASIDAKIAKKQDAHRPITRDVNGL